MEKDEANIGMIGDASEDRSLGELVRGRRTELRLTQEEVAERMGGSVHQADISQIERGVINYPRRDRLTRLADALELPYETVFAASGWGNAYRESDGPDEPEEPEEPPVEDGPLLAELARVFGKLSESGRTSVLSFAGYIERQERSARRKTKRRAGENDG